MSKPVSDTLQRVCSLLIAEIEESRQDERDQTLMEMATMMAWLTGEPKVPLKDLQTWVTNLIEHSASSLPPEASIHKTIEHYKEVFKQ